MTKEQKEKKEKFLLLIKKLQKSLDPGVVLVEFVFLESIILKFSNGHKILVSAWGNDTEHKIFFTPGLTLIQDFEFKNTTVLLSDLSKKVSFETGMSQLKTVLQAFSNKKMDRIEKIKHYGDLAQEDLRVLVSEYFNLGLDPRQEYFVFGSDEIVSRYGRKKLQVKPKGIKVVVQDRSAIIIDRNGTRYLDLDHGGYYKTDTHIYYDHSIWHPEPCSPEESTMVSYNSATKEKSLWKMVLNEGVDLSKVINKVAYVSADKMVLTIKKVNVSASSKTSYYTFEDREGPIAISHPDLLIYVLE